MLKAPDVGLAEGVAGPVPAVLLEELDSFPGLATSSRRDMHVDDDLHAARVGPAQDVLLA